MGPGKYGPKVIWNSKLAPVRVQTCAWSLDAMDIFVIICIYLDCRALCMCSHRRQNLAPPVVYRRPSKTSTSRRPPPQCSSSTPVHWVGADCTLISPLASSGRLFHSLPCYTPTIVTFIDLICGTEDGKSAAPSLAATSIVSGMDRLSVRGTSGTKHIDDTPGVDQCLSTTGLIEGSPRKSQHHRTVTPRVQNVDDIPSVDQCLGTSGLLERYVSPRAYRQRSASKLDRSRSSAAKAEAVGRVSTRRQLGDREEPRKASESPQKKLWHHHYHHMPKGGGVDASKLMAESIREAEEAAARAAEALARTHHSMRLGAGDDETDVSSFHTASTRRSRSYR